jgi:hypothetical protein
MKTRVVVVLSIDARNQINNPQNFGSEGFFMRAVLLDVITDSIAPLLLTQRFNHGAAYDRSQDICPCNKCQHRTR